MQDPVDKMQQEWVRNMMLLFQKDLEFTTKCLFDCMPDNDRAIQLFQHIHTRVHNKSFQWMHGRLPDAVVVLIFDFAIEYEQDSM
jgi:hypothetical protein